MKSRLCIRLTISFVVALVTAIISVKACGPYYPIIPTPNFFESRYPKSFADYEKEENLKLWQSMTSKRIPLSEIEEVIYKDSWDDFYRTVNDSKLKTDNRFYAFLKNTSNPEFYQFLVNAKLISEKWQAKKSPWYYPTNDRYDENFVDWDQFLDILGSYDGRILKDRYALQYTRTLFAARRYQDCILYADSAFVDIPHQNLMKQLAYRYVAGCWSRLGEVDKADSIFAKVGDIWSITKDKRIELTLKLNPNAPQIMEYIRCNSSDSALMVNLIPEALKMVKDQEIKAKGDWYYLLAYANSMYKNNIGEAKQQIHKALNYGFSSEEFKQLARAYKMKIDAKTGNKSHLYEDLKWIETHMDVLDNSAGEWIRIVQNIIYENWIPILWKEKDYTTAILLCSYVDNLGSMKNSDPFARSYTLNYKPYYSLYDSARYMEESDKRNGIDYGSLSFQLMGSLTSSQLATVYSEISRNKPLNNLLRQKALTDKDYFYEVIGTLALREENYSRAIKYLSKVSDKYLASMNIDIDGYLDRDPFICYSARWAKITPSYVGGEEYYLDNQAADHTSGSNPRGKLNFAKSMLQYQKTMKHGKSADERGMARLMYALGRRNSFEECWALTQYWRGFVSLFSPILNYWEDDFEISNYDFIYDYETAERFHETERIYNEEIAASLAMMKGDETKAKANYLLGNLKQIVKLYGDTKTGKYVKSSCDNWRNWL